MTCGAISRHPAPDQHLYKVPSDKTFSKKRPTRLGEAIRENRLFPLSYALYPMCRSLAVVAFERGTEDITQGCT